MFVNIAAVLAFYKQKHHISFNPNIIINVLRFFQTKHFRIRHKPILLKAILYVTSNLGHINFCKNRDVCYPNYQNDYPNSVKQTKGHLVITDFFFFFITARSYVCTSKMPQIRITYLTRYTLSQDNKANYQSYNCDNIHREITTSIYLVQIYSPMMYAPHPSLLICHTINHLLISLKLLIVP